MGNAGCLFFFEYPLKLTIKYYLDTLLSRHPIFKLNFVLKEQLDS